MMALADKFREKRGQIAMTALAAPLAFGLSYGAFTGAAQAQDTNAVQPVATEQIAKEAELEQLGQAIEDAHTYATKCFERGENCVGILLHIGDDFYKRRDELAKANNLPEQTVEQFMIKKLEENYVSLFAPHNVDVKVFPSPNAGTPATGVSFHTNDILYETAEGKADLDLKIAKNEVPNVVRSLQTLRQQASLDNDNIILANNSSLDRR